MSRTAEEPVALIQAGEFVPPDTTVWQKYNERLEMPISFASSILLFTGCFFTLVVLLLMLESGPDRKPVPITLWNGEDPFGAGSSGKGGVEDPIASGFTPPTPETLQKLKPQIPIRTFAAWSTTRNALETLLHDQRKTGERSVWKTD